jgi:molybdopterin/thiamine biosynthesis adenylyltransferase
VSWAADAEATWAEFVRGLTENGFELDDSGVPIGEVSFHNGTTDRTVLVEVTKGLGFPFLPPRVRPWDGSGARSWHQERDGTLCLYAPEGNTDWPWLDPALLLERVGDWFARDSAGWPGVPPDLDLERYLESGGFPAMILYRGIETVLNKPIRLRRRGRGDVFDLSGTGVRPRGNAKRHDQLWGEVVDLGQLERPFHDWAELAARLGDRARVLERRVRDGHIQILLVHYLRGDRAAVAAKTATASAGSLEVRSVESADDSARTRALRAPDAANLKQKRVAVVGNGAVGGFVADMLLRDGVGHLGLVDGERLRPGNCVRHILGHGHVGENKAIGLRRALIERHDVDPDSVTAIDNPAWSGEDAASLLREYDLVINATAADLPTGLLNHCAEEAATPVLSVHLEREGELIVVHRRPLAAGASNYDLAPDPRSHGEPLLEGGCGDPVARTAPHAAMMAAALCCDLAIRALLGDVGSLAATVVQVLRPQPDPPLDAVATLEWR